MIEIKNGLPTCLCSPVAVVCHDAGAANLVFAWLRDWTRLGLLDQIEFRLILDGPAKVAWVVQEMLLPCMQMHTELNSALSGANCVLTGTGWASHLEHEARKLASLLRIPSIAVIDHWVNYQQRFERTENVVLPDVIWVSDPYAADMARTLFKSVDVIELPNAYLEAMVKTIPPVKEDCWTLLYVLEPMRTDWGRATPGEFQALDYFAKNIHLITGDNLANVLLRPHPSDKPEKYTAWMQDNLKLNPKLDFFKSLNDSIANSRWVVGAETYAMVVAIEANRDTWSSLPPWGHQCRLPQSAIKHIKDRVRN